MAEGDRDAYRREQAAVAREKEIMKDVKGWEVSDPCRTPMMCTHDTVDCDLFLLGLLSVDYIVFHGCHTGGQERLSQLSIPFARNRYPIVDMYAAGLNTRGVTDICWAERVGTMRTVPVDHFHLLR